MRDDTATAPAKQDQLPHRTPTISLRSQPVARPVAKPNQPRGPSGALLDNTNSFNENINHAAFAGNQLRMVLGPDRVAPGDCSPGAPTDPYVLALEHTVPQNHDYYVRPEW